jgi:hypothetical protein
MTGRWPEIQMFFAWAESTYGPGLTLVQALRLKPLYQTGYC